MKNKLFLGLAALAIVAFLSSCGKVPQAQIDATNAAIDSAKTMQADVYLPVEFAAVKDSMSVIMTGVEAQKSKLFKKFGPTKVQLDVALGLVKQLQANTVIKKEEVKKEVETLLTDIKAVIAENTKLFVRAPRGKEGAQVLEQMKTEMATVETSVTDAQALYDKGDYMDAYNKVKAAKEIADRINGEVKDAIKKVGGKV
jgi:uncharacterized protein YicC (UPF0701 family)